MAEKQQSDLVDALGRKYKNYLGRAPAAVFYMGRISFFRPLRITW